VLWEALSREEPNVLGFGSATTSCGRRGRMELLAGREARRWFGTMGQGRVFGTRFVSLSPKRSSL